MAPHWRLGDTAGRRVQPIQHGIANERRTAQRYELHLNVLLGKVAGTTRNVGLDGMLFVSGTAFDAGHSLRALVAVPLDPPDEAIDIDAVATVLRSHPEGDLFVTAVRFESVQFSLRSSGPAASSRPEYEPPGSSP